MTQIGEGFGAALYEPVFQMVAGGGKMSEPGLRLLLGTSTAASAILMALGLLGTAAGRVQRRGIFRLLLICSTALLAYLWLARYGYGYSKAQAMTTFLFVTAASLGIERTCHRASERFAKG